jgi:hypothetical protein
VTPQRKESNEVRLMIAPGMISWPLWGGGTKENVVLFWGERERSGLGRPKGLELAVSERTEAEGSSRGRWRGPWNL